MKKTMSLYQIDPTRLHKYVRHRRIGTVLQCAQCDSAIIESEQSTVNVQLQSVQSSKFSSWNRK